MCYDEEGFAHFENEPDEKTKKGLALTLNNGHHSVYDNISISFNLQNIPKILASAFIKSIIIQLIKTKFLV